MNSTQIDVGLVVAALDDLRNVMSADGAELHLTSIDGRDGVVEIELDVSGAGCGECLLPPDVLLAMVDAGLKERVPGSYRVEIVDPRRTNDLDARRDEPEPDDVLGEVVIVDPAAEVDVGDDDPGPSVGDLAGKTVGIRVDVLWRSWDWVVDEWTALLEHEGATVAQWRRAQGLAGDDGQEHRDAYPRFLATVDVAIVGLANCGSCTSWTIKDAVAAAATGVPTVAVATHQFESLAHTLAGLYGRPALRLQVLPYPLDIRPEAEVRAIARERFPALLAGLGAGVRADV